jgi:hypothetical protein
VTTPAFSGRGAGWEGLRRGCKFCVCVSGAPRGAVFRWFLGPGRLEGCVSTALALFLASVVLAGGPSVRQVRGGGSFDWVGAALLALSLVLVVLGVSSASPLFTGLGLVALVFTGLYNGRRPRPSGRGWEKALKMGVSVVRSPCGGG